MKFLTYFVPKLSQNTPEAGRKIHLLPYFAASFAFVMVLGVTGVLDYSEQKRFQEQHRATALSELSAVRARLEGALNQRLFLERGLVAYVSAINPDIDQKQFESLAEVIVARQRGIRSVALYKNLVVTHLYPLAGNEAAIGFEPMSIPEEREAIERAIRTRKTVVAGPIDLVPQGVAFISRTPVFLTPPGQAPESGDFWGMVGIIIDKNTLLQDAGLIDPSAKLHYTIRGKDGLGDTGEVFFGDEKIYQQDPVILSVTLPNGSWQLAAVPAQGWPSQAPISKWLKLGGGVLALVAGGLVYILVRWPAKLQEAVARATGALKNSEAALMAANAELQHLDRIKDEFLANTSHELRTPLHGMIGIAESMIDGATGQLSELQQQNLLMIAQSGHRLNTLVNDLLDFSKLKHKNIELQLKPVGMREITEVVLTLSKALVGKKNLQLINKISPDLPMANADENRVQQILYNLIGNAIKFTQSGIVEISAELVKKDLAVSSTNSQLAITVSDTGIGIPKDKLDRIFESFEQADGSTAREYGGTGLGLTVTKQLVELHNGEIWVESTPGVGSRFTFTLPASVEERKLEREEQETSSQTHSPIPAVSHPPSLAAGFQSSQLSIFHPESVSQFKILIVDDEPVNLQVLVNHLSLQNYAIIQAANGIEALAAFEKGFQPDLVLLDVMMPKMTGYEVCRELRENFPAHELPIVLLTAKNQVADLVEGLDAGANDYLTKPISKYELLARIKTHINLANISRAYGRFVPHEFLQLLNKESIIDVKLGDAVQQNMSILFSDIRDFTTISETMTPEENFQFINSYLSRMEPAIASNHGFIDKYIGDAIMALFGDSADRAVKAGLAMLQRQGEYNQDRQQAGRSPIKIGIGINTGSLMLGTVGGHNRMDGTVISDAVNLASRIEGLTKNYGVSLLISHHTFSHLQHPNDYSIRLIDKVTVKGKSELVTVYEVFDADSDKIREGKLMTVQLFEEALSLYNQEKFLESAQCFKNCLAKNPEDQVAQIYLKRCQVKAWSY
ncbi:ATP-binding protein [Microcoleus sp. FACHB-68]|uniref:ATP-binding protein n=1 Tax=Microcoleus sp. FACHB-68 TaxID=2692826 RepID=UPI0016868AAD|nr:ATP-binding protein [Microcoleus sp. FACHB-68]MBD1939528.1 response regulator [Microcoleus sp. FACHB-68]